MTSQNRSRFGRAKFGGGPKTLIAVSAAVGLVLSIALSVIVALTAFTENTPLAVALFTAFTAPWLIAIVWVLLVDRDTVEGAIDKPEQSIESRWYALVAQDTVHALLWSVGVMGVASVFVDASVSLGTATIVLGVFLTVVFGVAYFLRKRSEA
ncbi:hypothetical protein [Corynebacterium massiliense]|uniref:Uncharacterized protein n=1 Tax=Corynebacterium massiliense DSM 45435 TaxID=1121364 RepID=A0ABY7U551_9CORY|nr:hypothetical protein [Corynebacterium massiliense]WCZ31526.1 hypothetical protein CMASS_00275 [Corynebacterium massiliense DSM 45435]